MNREEIFGALFAKLEAIRVAGAVVTASRRLRHIEDVSPSEMPAVFQVQQDEAWNARNHLPTVKTFTVDWWMYVHEPDTTLPASIKLNNLMDSLDAALGQEGPGLDLETLGGSVYNAKFHGAVEIYEGILGDRAMAILPIRIVKAN